MKIYALFCEEGGDLTCLAASYQKAKVTDALQLVPEGARAFFLNPSGIRKVKTKSLKVDWNKPAEVTKPEPVAEIADPNYVESEVAKIVAAQEENNIAYELMQETKRRGRPPKV